MRYFSGQICLNCFIWSSRSTKSQKIKFSVDLGKLTDSPSKLSNCNLSHFVRSREWHLSRQHNVIPTPTAPLYVDRILEKKKDKLKTYHTSHSSNKGKLYTSTFLNLCVKHCL